MTEYDNTNGTIRIFMILISIILIMGSTIMSQNQHMVCIFDNYALLVIPLAIILSILLIKTTYVSKYAYNFGQNQYPWFAPTFVIAIIGGLILMFTSHFILTFIYWIIWGIRYENWCESH